MASGEAGRLYQVMAAMARPVRLTRGKQIDAAWSLDESLLQQDEERALVAAFKAAAAQVGREAGEGWRWDDAHARRPSSPAAAISSDRSYRIKC
mgnify:CR=1 FL=1